MSQTKSRMLYDRVGELRVQVKRTHSASKKYSDRSPESA